MSDLIDYYQTIPDVGIKGRKNTQEEFDKVGMPKDLKDKSVIDIGCNTGAFLIEAHKRGATNCMGVEPDDDWRYLGNGIMKELGLNIPIYKDLPVLRFDVVLLLSVLHVCKEPQKLLNDAWEMTKGLLIVEINDRLQGERLVLPEGDKIYGYNKDNRSVHHFSKIQDRG